MMVMGAIDHEQEDQRVLIAKGAPDLPLHTGVGRIGCAALDR